MLNKKLYDINNNTLCISFTEYILHKYFFIISKKIKPYLLDFASLILYICSIKEKAYNYSLKP